MVAASCFYAFQKRLLGICRRELLGARRLYGIFECLPVLGEFLARSFFAQEVAGFHQKVLGAEATHGANLSPVYFLKRVLVHHGLRNDQIDSCVTLLNSYLELLLPLTALVFLSLAAARSRGFCTLRALTFTL